LEFGQGLGNRLVDVLLVVGFAGRHEDPDFAHAGRDRAVEALAIGHERAVDEAGLAMHAARDFRRVGKLRDPFGRDEARDLDAGHAGLAQRIDERDLVGRRYHARLVLQAVAWTHLVDRNALRQLIEHAVTLLPRTGGPGAARRYRPWWQPRRPPP